MGKRQNPCKLGEIVEKYSAEKDDLLRLDVPGSSEQIGVASGDSLAVKVVKLKGGICAMEWGLDPKKDVVRRVIDKSHVVTLECGVEGCGRVIEFAQPRGGTTREGKY